MPVIGGGFLSGPFAGDREFPINASGTTYLLWDESAVKLQMVGDHFKLETDLDGKTLRFNSRNYDQTSGGSLGFQCKPNQSTNSSGNVVGGEISPRLSSGVALSGSGSITGLHVDVFLKGTASGTVAGNCRGLEVELVTDDSGTRTIDGYVTGLRFRSAFSATTITGEFSAIRFEKPEAQTNSKTYTTVFEMPSTIPLVWNDTPGTEPSTADGYIKVVVNGSDRFIQLYSSAPVD